MAKSKCVNGHGARYRNARGCVKCRREQNATVATHDAPQAKPQPTPTADTLIERARFDRFAAQLFGAVSGVGFRR